MKILYLCQQDINIEQKGIYADLINELISNGHEVVLSCADSKYDKTQLVLEPIKKVQVKVPNQFGVNVIKKGLIILSLESIITKAIKKFLKDESFDLVLYATPPITLANVVKYCKKKYKCKSYLMLKDIFPQNAVDLGMMSKSGVMGIMYKLFRAKEKALYVNSDAIGCMSQANVDYLKEHNKYLADKHIEIFANSLKVQPLARQDKNKELLAKYKIPCDKLLFIYGGNLGKPQGLDFFAKAIEKCKDIDNVHFVIAGKGSEKEKLFKSLQGLDNVSAFDALPKDEYEQLCNQCDVGIVMLDYRFTIPNYPSRTLSYMQNGIPVFACTDKNTDIKELVEEQAKCGKWCWSNDTEEFVKTVKWFADNEDKLTQLGKNGYDYLSKNFNIEKNVKQLQDFCDIE